MRHEPIDSQQRERDENANTCQHISECLVGFVAVCYESRTQNNGGCRSNQEEAFGLWQLFPGRKHAIASRSVSDGTKQDCDNAKDAKTPSLKSLHVHAHDAKKCRKNGSS